MCGRFNLRANPHQLAEIFALLREPIWEPRYDIRPTNLIVTIRQAADGSRTGDLLSWGLIPHWAKDRTSPIINARSDSVATRPAFKDAFKKRRCIIPADGFYEWQKLGSKTKQKWHIYRANGQVISFAGIWETWLDDDDQPLETCSIITTDANPMMSTLHDRMPVILPETSIGFWLDQGVTDLNALQALLQPCPNEWLKSDPVLNLDKVDSPDCIRPVKPQRGLFD